MHVQRSAGLVGVRVMHDQRLKLIWELDYTVRPVIKIGLLQLVGDDGSPTRGESHFLHIGCHCSGVLEGGGGGRGTG